MQTILKGGLGTIRVVINGEDGANYEGVLHVLFCGIKKSVLNPQAGETYTLDFSDDETRAMPLGCWDVKIVFENEQGKRTLSNVATKILVTDDAECVYTDSPFAVAPGSGAQVDEIGDEYTMKDLKNALNKIIKLTHVIALFALPCFGDIVHTAPLEDVKNWMPVVTNVDVSVIATKSEVVASTNSLMQSAKDFVRWFFTPIGEAISTNVVNSINNKRGDVVLTAGDVGAVDDYGGRITNDFGLAVYNRNPNGGLSLDHTPKLTRLACGHLELEEYGAYKNDNDWGDNTLYYNIGRNGSNGEFGIYGWVGGEKSAYGKDIKRTSLLFPMNGESWQHLATVNNITNTIEYFETNTLAKTYATKANLAAATNAIDVTAQLAPMQSSLAQISQTVDGVVAYVTGEDSYLSVTNYDSQTHTPSMKLVQKMPADSDHAEPWERVVWDELTRWNNFMLGEWKTLNEETIPATRQWGFYDSKTGHIQPDEDVLNVSQSKVVLSPGMEWQKTITTGGCAVWILTYNEPIDFVPTENGFFRITDADGNVLQEIIKGDKRVVGATAFSATMVNGNFEVEYRVATDAHPEVYVCNDLRNAVWTKVTESDIVDGSSWLSNTSGNYRIAITPKTGQSKMFVRATYEVGGNTYIRNNVAHSSDKIVIGGVEYNVTVETISGKKVPVLTEAH